MKARQANKAMIGVAAVLVMAIIAGGYIVKTTMSEDNPPEDGEIVIGYCADNLVIERWQRDQEIFIAKAMEQDVKVIVLNANEDNETQKNQILSLIEKKVDVIVVIPYDKEGLTEVIDLARKEGIKVIAYDRLIKNTVIDAYISFDNVKVGQLQAEALLEKVPTGNYVIINGSPDDNNSSMFNEGYMLALAESIKSKQIKVVQESWADNWREEPAYEAVSDLLDEGVHIDAIIAANDRLAEAAINALAEEGLAGQVMVAGHDADISACQRIVEGTQYVTIYKPIRDLAESALNLAIQMAMGEEIEYEETINNGTIDVPYIKLDVMTVTEETMLETVVADGFHLKEDIYRK